MARFVGLDVSQKLTSICVVDESGRRLCAQPTLRRLREL
jgi:hypothetical protein